MRALNLLSLVIASGCWLLPVVGAQAVHAFLGNDVSSPTDVKSTPLKTIDSPTIFSASTIVTSPGPSSATPTSPDAGPPDITSSAPIQSSSEPLQDNTSVGGSNETPSSTVPASIASTPQTLPSSPILTSAAAVATSDSGGLSTGAKAGIAVGAVVIALIVLFGALLIWRRRRQQQKSRAVPDGMPYSHDTGSTNRDLTAEKEINVINSPVDTLNNGYSSVPSAAHAQHQPQASSWGPSDEHSATDGAGAGAAAAAAPYTDAHRRSYGSGDADSSSPATTPPPAAASGSSIQRKPVGATSGGTTQHLREPGMSDEEVARLEEEERRLDEAIAEAERKRQVQS